MSQPGRGGRERLPTLTEVVDLAAAPGLDATASAGPAEALPADPAAWGLGAAVDAPSLQARLEALVEGRLRERLDDLLAPQLQALRESLQAEMRAMLVLALRELLQPPGDRAAPGCEERGATD